MNFLTGTGAVVHVVGKREAEADPSYLAYGLPLVHYPLAYSVAVGGRNIDHNVNFCIYIELYFPVLS